MKKYEACVVEVWEEKPLTELDTKYGGIIMICHENRIVYDNTLEKRSKIAVEMMIPEIRKMMFPNIKAIDNPN